MLRNNALKVSINSLPSAIFVCQQDGIIVQVNSQVSYVFGYDEKSLIGKKIKTVIPELEISSFYGFNSSVKAGANLVDVKYEENFIAYKKDKTEFPVTASCSFFELDSESFTLVSIQDVSQLYETQLMKAELEKQLRQTQKFKSLGLLTCNIAHDFNNMLYVILGNADQVISESRKESSALSQLYDIKTATLQLAELTKQLLIYSGGDSLEKSEASFSEIVEEMGRLLQISFTSNINVSYDLMLDMPKADVISSQVRQVILNFITNAIDSIGDREGTIDISTGMMEITDSSSFETFTNKKLAPGEYAFIEVRDNGKGIKKADIKRLFDLFFSTKKENGHGVGLSTVLEIIRSHKGAISISSTLFKGASFKALFPCVAPVVEETIDYSELIQQAFDECELGETNEYELDNGYLSMADNLARKAG